MTSDDEWAAHHGRRQPNDDEWAAAEQRHTPGSIVAGPVISHHAFGYFIDLGDPILGLVEIPFARDQGQRTTPADYPPIGTRIEAVVFGASPQQRQIRINARPSDLARARHPEP